MKRHYGVTAQAALLGARSYILIGILSLLMIGQAVYATADVNDDSKENVRIQAKSGMPEYSSEQIKKESAMEWSGRTRFGGDMRLRGSNDRAGMSNSQLAQNIQPVAAKKGEANNSCNGSAADGKCLSFPASDQGITGLVELLKRKKVISAAEADHIIKKTANGGGNAALDSDGLAALAVLLESKKIITTGEASQFTKKYAAGGTVPGDSAQVDNEALKKDIHDQVAKQVRDELAKEKELKRQQIAAYRKKQKEETAEGQPDETVNGAAAADEEVPVENRVDDLDRNVSYLQQKVSEIFYGGQAGALAKSQLPGWLSRFRLSGDIRLRYEHDRFAKNNVNGVPVVNQGTVTSNLENTFADTDRFKYRVRLGVEADVAENMAGNAKLLAAVRLSTGNTTNPVSTNTLLGDYMNKDNILFDQAYLKFTWKTFANAPTVFTALGGRMPNPWFHSDLVWDPDLNFEGLAFNLKHPLTETESWSSFLTVGAFPLQQSDPGSITDFSQHRKWLYAGQVGIERKDRTGISVKGAVAYYAYNNITGVFNTDAGHPNATDWSAPLFTQGDGFKGNTLFYLDASSGSDNKIGLASKFDELDLIGTLDIGFWDPVHVVLLGDYVKNIGWNMDSLKAASIPASIPREDIGYQIGLSVSKPAIETDEGWHPGWKLFVNYKYLQADAVVDAFADSDFHLGGTNAKGWILGAEYGLMKNTWLTIKYLTADQISGPRLAIDVLQVDLNARF